MTTRTALPGTATTGTTWDSTDIDSLPGGWIGYVENTSHNQTSISSIVDITDLDALTVTVNTSRRIRIEGLIQVTMNTAGGRAKLIVREGATSVQVIANNTMETGENAVLNGAVVLTPTAGSHTYKLSLVQADGGAATIATSCGTGDAPKAYLLVQDIGPA